MHILPFSLAMISPLANLFGMVVGMTHQIRIVLELRKSNLSASEIEKRLSLLSIPRLMLGIFCGILSMLYGLEIRNYWMFGLSFIGVVLNLVFTSAIWSVAKEIKTRS